MKRKLLSILFVSVLVLGITGCGNKSDSKKDNNDSKSSKVEKVSSIRDNSIYYVIINGKKFKAGDKISSISKAGLKLKDKDLDQTIPKNRYLLAKYILDSNDKEVCEFVPLNDGDSTITVKEAVIGGFEVGDINYDRISKETLALKIEVAGGIKLGSTLEEVQKVFGKEDFKYEAQANEQLKMPSYTSYKYSSGYKGYEFLIDNNGKVSQIKWNNYNYDEK